MALTKMGSIVTQVSGKIGGQTFGTAQGGNYVKNTGSYINKLTTSRVRSNSRLASLANSWRSLTTAQKNAWAAAAPNFPYINRLGETKTYSGYNLYMKFNGNRALFNLTPVATAPIPYVFTSPNIDDLGVATTEIFISLANTDANVTYAFFLSNPSSAGSSFNLKGLRFLKSAVGNGAIVTTQLLTEYQAIFGTPLIGSRIFFKVFMYQTASGIKSGFSLSQSLVVVS